MTETTDSPCLIRVSTAAADKIAELIAEEKKPHLHLRIFVHGGGCSGLQYGLTFDEFQEADTLIAATCSDGQSSVKVLIDSMSSHYLKAAEIDYVKNLQAEQFVIRNPNAKTTCGCGSSFSVDEEA